MSRRADVTPAGVVSPTGLHHTHYRGFGSYTFIAVSSPLLKRGWLKANPMPSANAISCQREIPILPTEVCERIIDFVAEDFPGSLGVYFALRNPEALETLRACSLTCRAWTLRAQLYLLLSLGVQCSPRHRRCPEALGALVRRNPALHTYVEYLTAYVGNDKTSTWRRLMLQAPRMLTHLRSIELAHGVLYLHPSRAFEMSMRQFTSVTQLVLRTTTFYSIVDLRRAVSAIPTLQHLTIHLPRWCPTSDCRSPPPQYPQCRVRLHTITIGAEAAWLSDPRAAYFVEWLGRSGVACSLKEIHFGRMMVLDSDMLRAVEALVDASTRTLRRLGLMFHPDIDFTQRTSVTRCTPDTSTTDASLTTVCAALSRCERLTGISLVLPYDTSPVSRLPAFLDKLSAAKVYGLWLLCHQYPGMAGRTPTFADWARIDGALQQKKWKSLNVLVGRYRPVTVTHRVPFVWGDWHELGSLPGDDQELSSDLGEWLPLTCKRGKLWCRSVDGNAQRVPVS